MTELLSAYLCVGLVVGNLFFLWNRDSESLPLSFASVLFWPAALWFFVAVAAECGFTAILRFRRKQ